MEATDAPATVLAAHEAYHRGCLAARDTARLPQPQREALCRALQATHRQFLQQVPARPTLSRPKKTGPGKAGPGQRRRYDQ